MFTVEIAGICVGIDNKYDFIKQISQGFIVDKAPLFIVNATDSEIMAEAVGEYASFKPCHLEPAVIHRKIAECAAEYGILVFHGVALKEKEKGYLFTARSGVGKSTHAALWTAAFSGVEYINGDKPFLKVNDEGIFLCGSPWQGKENYGANTSAPLSAIAFIRRASENKTYKIDKDKALIELISQIYLPKDSRARAAVMLMASKIISSIPLYVIECNTDISAARVSHSVIAEVDND